jgi:hypothetical protein
VGWPDGSDIDIILTQQNRQDETPMFWGFNAFIFVILLNI